MYAIVWLYSTVPGGHRKVHNIRKPVMGNVISACYSLAMKKRRKWEARKQRQPLLIGVIWVSTANRIGQKESVDLQLYPHPKLCYGENITGLMPSSTPEVKRKPCLCEKSCLTNFPKAIACVPMYMPRWATHLI